MPTPAPAYRRFTDFAANSAKFIAGLAAATPIFAQFSGAISPKLSNSSFSDKAVVLAAGISAGSMVLSVFYIRHLINRAWHLLLGVVLIIAGLFLLSFVNDPATACVGCTYIAGFSALALGAAFILLYGFVREAQREASLLDAAPTLSFEEWQRLESLSSSMLRLRERCETLRSASNNRLSDAVMRSASIVEGGCVRLWERCSRGIFEVREDRMIEVFRLFAGAIDKKSSGGEAHFRAVSFDDFAYWYSPGGERYLEINREMTQRGTTVFRIIVLQKEYSLTEKDVESLDKHFSRGVKLGFARFEEIAPYDLVPDSYTDFALFDDFALSTFLRSDGRLFRVSVDHEEVERHAKQFMVFEQHCFPEFRNGKKEIYFSNLQELKSSPVFSRLKG